MTYEAITLKQRIWLLNMAGRTIDDVFISGGKYVVEMWDGIKHQSYLRELPKDDDLKLNHLNYGILSVSKI